MSEYYVIIITMLKNENLTSQVKEVVSEAEELRVKAAENGFNEDIFQQSLHLVDSCITRVEETGLDDADNQLVAGFCHLHLIESTIHQSRAKHTLTSKKDQIIALDQAAGSLNKANELGKRLVDRDYFQTIDKTPFIWPAEINRGMGRIKMRHPLSGEEEISQAEEHFRQAEETALEVYSQNESSPQPDRQLCGAGLMTAAVAQVEKLTVQKRLDEIKNDQWQEDSQVKSEIAAAIIKMHEAENYGYFNPNRKNAFRTLIEKELGSRVKYTENKNGLQINW